MTRACINSRDRRARVERALQRLTPLGAIAVLAACGDTASDRGAPDATAGQPDAGPGAPDGGAPGPEIDAGAAPVTDDELARAEGCAGVFNPDQVLDYHLEMEPGDWSALLADQTNSVYYPAQLSCAGEPAITVGVRRKRSGGAVKVGLKIDINQLVPGQTYHGLRKLSMENGVSEGTSEDGAPVSTHVIEYLGWRLMQRAGVVASRAVFARVHVNGDLLGVYVNVEQVDKRFLRSRLGDDDGWLYKKSGSAGDGLKTHENDGLEDPYVAYFCFWLNGRDACDAPSAEVLAEELPEKLDIEGFLRMGAVNALIANTDAPLFKDNNYYYYDWYQGRVYLPWDLDTTMRADYDVFTGDFGGANPIYAEVLFTNWEDDYAGILTELLEGELTLEAILGEIARAGAVAGDAFASDPHVSGTMAEAAASLESYWTARHAAVTEQVSAH